MSGNVVSQSQDYSSSLYRPNYKRQRTGRVKMSKMLVKRGKSTKALIKEYSLAKAPIMQSCQIDILLHNQTGWAAAGQSLCWAFNLNGAAYSVGGGAFNTEAFENSAQLVNIYDQWKLTRVQVTMDGSFNDFSTVENRWMLNVYSAIDKNDGNATSVSELLSYSTVKKTKIGLEKEGKMTLYSPTVQGALETTSFGGFTTAGQCKTSPWISTDSPTIAHYGIKYAAKNNAQAAWSMSVTFFVQCFFEFKNTK